MMPTKLWRKSLGERGLRVYLYERTPGGNLYREVYVGGQRVAAKKSLRHRDRERAEADGYRLLAKLKAREAALTGGRLTLSALFDMYVVSAAHRAKKERTRRADETMLNRVIGFVGPGRHIQSLCASDVKRYTEARQSGRCGPSRRPVRARTVQADLVALQTMLNWAVNERDSGGRALLDANPLKGVRLPQEKSPRRPIETYDRFLKLMAVAHEVDGRLPVALTLAEATGQRIGSILQLRRSDLDLGGVPHGKVRFRAETQKTGVEHWTPVSSETARVLDQHVVTLPEDVQLLFPANGKPSVPVTVSVMSKALRKAYQQAELRPLRGGLWHPWRRKWATERKGMPLIDVAAAGGWKDTETLLRCYQQPDEGTLAAVVLDAPKLRSAAEVTPNATPPSEKQRPERPLHLKVV